MKVGFTGTQEGMTKEQKEVFITLFEGLKAEEFHHGDCIGADEQVHEIVRKLFPEVKIHVHPPDKAIKRANCKGYHRIYAKKSYLVRNYDIVDMTEILIATPKTAEEELRSGTWAAVRYGKKQKLNETIVYIITPNGKVI
jgi:hypothetical protein